MAGEFDEYLLGAIRTVAVSGDAFEPFAQAVIPAPILGRLVELGLVEAGPSCRPAVAASGYRLTREGRDLAYRMWTRRHPSLLAESSLEAA